LRSSTVWRPSRGLFLRFRAGPSSFAAAGKPFTAGPAQACPCRQRALSHGSRFPNRWTEPAMTRPIIVFDLDGTLIDTAPDLLASLNHCLESVGLPPAEAHAFRSFVGMGGRVMIERAFAAQQRALDKVQLDELQVAF